MCVFKANRERRRMQHLSGPQRTYGRFTNSNGNTRFRRRSHPRRPAKEGRVRVICVGYVGRLRQRNWSKMERGRVEVSCCINFSFQGKISVPGEGTVCPEIPDPASGSPPHYPVLLTLLTFIQGKVTHTHTHTHPPLSWCCLFTWQPSKCKGKQIETWKRAHKRTVQRPRVTGNGLVSFSCRWISSGVDTI